ncbi:MAG TPA: LUD domain-containing protein, partial [Phnomibacter sp.]|nr:LUD domain-containing protein [Phnomibacter sp.]
MSANAKEQILQKIRKALTQATPQPFETEGLPAQAFAPPATDLDVLFAENFTAIQGQFSFCVGEQELVGQLARLAAARKMTKWYCPDERLRALLQQNGWVQPWHPSLPDCHASLTGAEALVARTGSILLSSRQAGGRTASIYAPVHICIAYTTQLVYDISDALRQMQLKYKNQLPSLISLASGPSRTA